jgi:hypothetical protein
LRRNEGMKKADLLTPEGFSNIGRKLELENSQRVSNPLRVGFKLVLKE